MQVEAAPGAKSCHYIANYNVEFSLIVGLHVQLSSLLDFYSLINILLGQKNRQEHEKSGNSPIFIMHHSPMCFETKLL